MQYTLSIRFHAPAADLPQHFGRVYAAILNYLDGLGEHATGAPFAAYYNMDVQHMDVEAGFPVERPLPHLGTIRAGKIPGGTFAVCHYTGSYEAMPPAYAALADFAKEHGYVPSGTAYEWYVDGPEIPALQRRTDITFPVMLLREPVRG